MIGVGWLAQGTDSVGPTLESRRYRYGLLSLAITSIGWGLNWPAMKFLLGELPPLLARGSSGLVSALLVATLAALQGQRMLVPRRLVPRLCAASFCNVFAWIGFTTLSMKWLSVSQAALLVYTMPLWATLLAWPILGHRPSRWSAAGLILCGAGLWSLLGEGKLQFSPGHAAGVGFALAAAFLFALGTVTLRPIAEMGPLSIVAWQLALGSLPMIVLGLAFESSTTLALSTKGCLAWLYMTAVPSGLCYLTWFAALRRLPPATASMATLLTPVIGVLSAALLLSELFTGREAAALLLTVGGVGLSLWKSST